MPPDRVPGDPPLSEKGRPATPFAGLCATCAHGREVVSGKGSRFLLCERSRTDAAYPRYPALPVLSCRGYEPSGQEEAG